MTFTVDENYYHRDGIDYIRVSRVTSVPNKPLLNRWRGNLGNDAADLWTEETSEIGVQTHKFISEIHRGKKFNTVEWVQLDARIQNALMVSQVALKTLKIKSVQTEVTLFSPLGYAGTTDMEARIGRERWLVDWKVASKLWPEVILQLSAYYFAYLATYPRKTLAGCMAIRLDRDGKPFNPRTDVWRFVQDDLLSPYDAFLGLLKYKQWEVANDSKRSG